MVMFAALALVAPAVWLLDLTDGSVSVRGGEAAVPVVTATVLLLLLVARLGLIARVAQRRSKELTARWKRYLTIALEEQQDLREQLAYRAMHDPLTGLSNRVVLAERLEWALTRRGGTRRHALLLLDLDGFKDINDTFGHPVGDEMLVDVAHRLVDAAPAGGHVARLGGDEFAVLLEDTDHRRGARRAERCWPTLRRSSTSAAGTCS